MNLREQADLVLGGEFLSREQSRELFGSALQDGADQVALADLLRGMAERSESVDEIIGAAEALRGAMIPFVHADEDSAEGSGPVDTCGTGGDGLGSFNLSTAAALVAASAGAKVIKHGNRSVSSKCGSADLLETAGVKLELDPAQARTVYEEVGMVFLFAPAFHPSMRFVAPVRKQLGIRTIFNYLGPLCSPGSVKRQLLGVGVGDKLDDYAKVMIGLGAERAYVVHGAGGADELTLEGPNRVLCVGDVPAPKFDASDLGLPASPVSALEGGDARVNFRMLTAVLDGADGPVRNTVLQNSCATLVVAGVCDTPASALVAASAALDSGATKSLLERLVEVSQKIGGDA